MEPSCWEILMSTEVGKAMPLSPRQPRAPLSVQAMLASTGTLLICCAVVGGLMNRTWWVWGGWCGE